MTNNKHSVKSFTILEMMIAMLISAIVIAITYTSYSIINKSYLTFKHKNEAIALLSRFDQLIKRDIEHADLVTGGAHLVMMRQTGKPDIYYEFETGHIIRKANMIDTFKIVNSNLQVLFERQEKSFDADTVTSEDNRIDEIIFDIEFQKEIMSYHYNKQYSSENLINKNPYAIN